MTAIAAEADRAAQFKAGWMRQQDMTHPALFELSYDHESVGVHGIAWYSTYEYTSHLTCGCGFSTGDQPSDRDAFNAIVAHAVEENAMRDLRHEITAQLTELCEHPAEVINVEQIAETIRGRYGVVALADVPDGEFWEIVHEA